MSSPDRHLRSSARPQPTSAPSHRRAARRCTVASTLALGVLAGGPRPASAEPIDAEVTRYVEAPDTYRVYVANESSDRVSRVAFTPEQGAWVESDIPVGLMPGDIDGAHGISVSPDGEYWYVTIAHGAPYGSVWQFHAGPDTLVGRSDLGLFPATMGLTPDGRFLLAVNFNLHGDMVPSSVSIVYTPNMMEVAKVETCLMPHGSRVNASGTRQYSVCMHSDQLVEINLGSLSVTSRFLVTPGHEASLGLGDAAGPVKHAIGATAGAPGAGNERVMNDAAHSDSPAWAHPPEGAQVCSPTWVEPATGVGADRRVYVACNKNAEVVEIDVDGWTVVRRFPTGAAPYNLDITPDGRRLVATLKAEQSIAVFDLETGSEIIRIATSQPVTHGVVISPDGRFAFVTNESVGATPGTLDVFDLETLTLTATVELGHQSGGIDYWPGPG